MSNGNRASSLLYETKNIQVPGEQYRQILLNAMEVTHATVCGQACYIRQFTLE